MDDLPGRNERAGHARRAPTHRAMPPLVYIGRGLKSSSFCTEPAAIVPADGGTPLALAVLDLAPRRRHRVHPLAGAPPRSAARPAARRAIRGRSGSYRDPVFRLDAPAERARGSVPAGRAG